MEICPDKCRGQDQGGYHNSNYTNRFLHFLPYKPLKVEVRWDFAAETFILRTFTMLKEDRGLLKYAYSVSPNLLERTGQADRLSPGHSVGNDTGQVTRIISNVYDQFTILTFSISSTGSQSSIFPYALLSIAKGSMLLKPSISINTRYLFPAHLLN